MLGREAAGRMEVLKSAPALAGFLQSPGSEGALRELAERLVPVNAEAGTALDTLAPALRFVVSGRVQQRRQRQLLPGDVQNLEAGSVCGLQHVARWLDPSRSDRGLSAVAAEPSRLLELRVEDFGYVPRPLLEWLLRVYEAGLLAEDLVLALGQEPRFANVPGPFLFRLVESASRVEPDAQPLLQRGRVPEDFFVLLAGSCRILRSGECIALLRGPVCIGHKQLLLQRRMAGEAVLDVSPRARTTVVRIDGGYFQRLLRKEPDFRRSVYRSNPELSPRPAPPAVHQVLMLDSREELPLRQLGDRLAERLAIHLQEHVLVLRVAKTSAEQGPPQFRKPEGTVNGWVAELTRQLPDSRARRGAPLLPRPEAYAWVSVGDSLAGNTNVTLVDVSALDAQERGRVLGLLARELEEYPDEPLKLVHLASAPEGFPRIDTLADRVQLVPTAVLSPEVPVGLGATVRGVLVQRSLTGRLKAAGQMLTSARSLVKAMGSHVAQLLRPAEQRSTWPMGTVRVRFPASWLESEALNHALPAEEPALRETFDRWARAVSGRRVGLALGGGGAFGYVHLALLTRLIGDSGAKGESETYQSGSSERVPVDLISGSSFGTVVGAFYSVAGREGLELMARFWPLLVAAFPLGVVSSVGVQWWLDAILGPVKLDQLEVPLFPVVVDSDAGVEWDVRQGTVGYGIRASGSFPPVMGPTLLGNRRLLDGGFVANVPVDVLRAEGADLLVASNPIPRLRPRIRQFSRLPLVRTLWNQLDPLLRVEDSFRMLTLIGRMAGEAQSAALEGLVVYRPKFNSASLFALSRARRVIGEAEDSLELGQALIEARAQWRARLNNPVSLVHWDSQLGVITLTEPVLFTDHKIEPVCQRTVLAELVDFLHQHKEIASFSIVATAGTRQEAESRAAAIREHLMQATVPQRPEAMKSVGRVSEGMKGPASQVTLERVESAKVDPRRAAMLEDAWRAQKELARKALAGAQTRRLQLEAEFQERTGDPELARLLVLEVARNDRSPETDRLLRLALDHRGLLLRRFDTEGSVTCLAWSPDGQWLASGYKDGSLRLWGIEEGEEIWRESAHPGGTDPQVSELAWSPSGNLLASSGSDFQLNLWERSDEGLSLRFNTFLQTWDQWGLAFSPDGTCLLAPAHGSPDVNRSAQVFRLGKRLPRELPEGLQGPSLVQNAAWAPEAEGRRFATVGEDAVSLWKVSRQGLEPLQKFAFPGASSLAWSPDAAALVVGGAHGAVIFRPGVRGGQSPLETQGQGVKQVAWSKDGRRVLATLPERGAMYVWDSSGTLQTVLRVEGEGLLQEVRCCPARPELALTWGGEAACVWDLSTGRQLAWLGGHTASIQEAAWSADGTRVATGSIDGTVRVWAPISGGPSRSSWEELEARRPHAKAAKDFQWPEQGVPLPLPASGDQRLWGVFSPDLSRAVLPVRDAKTGRWGLQPWSPSEPLPRKREEDWFEDVQILWGPDNRRIALREPGRVSIWDAKTWKLRAEYAREELQPTRISWHPSGDWLAIGRWMGWGQAVMLWEPERQAEPELLEGAAESDGIWDLAWSPVGGLLATACNDSHVRIYGAPEQGAVRGPPLLSLRSWYPPRRLAWSPTGELLATGDESGAVEIWSTDGTDLVASGQLRRQRIEHLAWSPDGSSLFSADQGGRGLIWHAGGSEWVTASVLESEPIRLRWATFSKDGKWVAAMERDGQVRLHPVGFDTLVGRVAALPGRKKLTLQEYARYVASPLMAALDTGD
jgi:WD40 repeat protein/predicted acylesterase/phospholipase RssA